MPSATLEELQQDGLVMSVARALALANEAVSAQGIDPAKSLVTIAEESTAAGVVWRISYGPRDYVHQRGGDLVVFVDDRTQSVQRILHGQ